jgi:hypothetical protein
LNGDEMTPAFQQAPSDDDFKDSSQQSLQQNVLQESPSFPVVENTHD